jgi:structural maintenance of chromosome 3 (chondroitin sulfate proteoglycan 6)
MHIKRIVIKGFKSYAAEVTVDNLSEGHTAVLGWNGAGKSNFFQAIQFVLCDTQFDKLRKADRVKLLHEGMGKREDRAYVEVLFDNADHRLPYATDVVTLRRQIGMDKDVFFVNTKHTSKNDVHAMLESAGFSRSNPYYILEQGKVKNLALMTDAKRLDLFKEVAGTNVYEDKRADAQNKLVEAQSAQLLIAEEYASLTKKLEHLEEEKSELQEYQQLDRRRRAFEHMLYSKECQHALNKLERIDMDRSSESENSELLHQMVTKTATQKRELEASIAQQESRLGETKARQAQLEAKRKGMLKAVAEKQQDYDEVSRHLSAARKHQAELEEELAVLEVDIQKCKDALGAEGSGSSSSTWSTTTTSTGAVAVFEAKLQTFEELRGRYAECMQVVTSLQDIQGRSSQFRTQRDRDTYLASQIKELNESIATVEAEAVDLGNDINRLENIQLAQVQTELADEMKRAEECASRITAAGETIQKLKEERNAG